VDCESQACPETVSKGGSVQGADAYLVFGRASLNLPLSPANGKPPQAHYDHHWNGLRPCLWLRNGSKSVKRVTLQGLELKKPTLRLG